MFAFTHVQPNGNHVVTGQSTFPEVTVLDIPLSGTPEWVVAVPTNEGSLWAVVLTDGTTQAFSLVGGDAHPTAISPAQIPAGMPPLLRLTGTQPEIVVLPDASPVTSPAPLDDTGQLAYVSSEGDVVILGEGGEEARYAVNALPDARLILDDGDIYLLSGPTGVYSHSVLGDDLEAESVTRIRDGEATVIITPEQRVIEGIAPILADLNGDGSSEVIITAANAQQGAQVQVYATNGDLIATGVGIGQGFRWRHQLAAGPFGPNGEIELVDNRTPHLGGQTFFRRLRGETLENVLQIPGYTSHIIGTRNLDMALAGDFDGNGRIEVALPSQDRTRLAGLTHDGSEGVIVWEVPVDGQVVSNVYAVETPGGLVLGLGRADGILRLWLPGVR